MDSIFDFSSFVIQAINLIIIALVLRSFFFKPYLRFLDEEAKKRNDLEAKLKETESLVSAAKVEADTIIDRSRVEAKVMASEIVENARKEASEITKRAELDADAARSKWFADIAYERKAMTDELKSKVLDVALKLNAKLFEKNEAHVDFLKKNSSSFDL